MAAPKFHVGDRVTLVDPKYNGMSGVVCQIFEEPLIMNLIELENGCKVSLPEISLVLATLITPASFMSPPMPAQLLDMPPAPTALKITASASLSPSIASCCDVAITSIKSGNSSSNPIDLTQSPGHHLNSKVAESVLRRASSQVVTDVEADAEDGTFGFEQLFRIQAKIVGKRFYQEKLNDGEIVHLIR